jgi:hypothetical protein
MCSPALSRLGYDGNFEPSSCSVTPAILRVLSGVRVNSEALGLKEERTRRVDATSDRDRDPSASCHQHLTSSKARRWYGAT